MRALIIGAGGMLGARLARRLAAEGALAGRPLEALALADLAAPPLPEGASFAMRAEAIDITAPDAPGRLIADRPDVIFHLAAIVSGQAEADFARGYSVNLGATQALFEAIRRANAAEGYRPRLVFASSVAVFGGPFEGEVVPEGFHLTPLSSYGTQKAIGELLLADYTRRGFLDGIALRLPTIVIRPGAPNRAASGFFSGILREPLAGLGAVLPVPESLRHWFASPRAAVGFLVHAAGLDGEKLGPRRALDMPGVSASVGEMIAALERARGPEAAALIRREPDPEVLAIVGGWAPGFEAARARALGFEAERSMDEIIGAHLEDEG